MFVVIRDPRFHRRSNADRSEPELLDWQKDEWEIAKRIVSTGRFQKLPTKFEVHEWEIMQDFSHSMESDTVREDLLYAIHGAGAADRTRLVRRKSHRLGVGRFPETVHAYNDNRHLRRV